MRTLNIILISITAGALLSAGAGCKTNNDLFRQTSSAKMEELKDLADKGNITAQSEVGLNLFHGINVAKINYDLADKYFRMGGNSSTALSLYYQAMISYYGLGTAAPDRARAQKLFEVAVERLKIYARENNIAAIFLLGEAAEFGFGMKQDLNKAIELYQYAAENGNIPAAVSLGRCYVQGRGVEVDIEKGRELLLRGAERSYPQAEYELAMMYFQQNRDELAMKWLQSSALKCYPRALYDLAVRQDERSVRLNNLRLAADSGLADAQYLYSQSLVDSAEKLGTQEQLTRLSYMRKAAQRGHIEALTFLAQLYKNDIFNPEFRSMAVYLIILEQLKTFPDDDPQKREIIRQVSALNQECGLFYPVYFAWNGRLLPENITILDDNLSRYAQAYLNKIKNAQFELQRNLNDFSAVFSLNGFWWLVANGEFDENYLRDYFLAQKDNGNGNQVHFYLSYAVAAGKYGQGGVQAYAATKLRDLISPEADPWANSVVDDLSALLWANALAMLGHYESAYEHLFKYGVLKNRQDWRMIGFINNHCRPLLKDKKRFAAVSGVNIELLNDFALPQTRKFFDLQTMKMTEEIPDADEPAIMNVN